MGNIWRFFKLKKKKRTESQEVCKPHIPRADTCTATEVPSVWLRLARPFGQHMGRASVNVTLTDISCSEAAGDVPFVIMSFSRAASLSLHGTLLDGACRSRGFFSLMECFHSSSESAGSLNWHLGLWWLPRSLSTQHSFTHSTFIELQNACLGARDTTVHRTLILPSHLSQATQKTVTTK